MTRSFFRALVVLLALTGSSRCFGQAAENLPTDYLSKEFHAGRRQALRDLMPANSVTVIFSYPEQVFSNDVNYVYHPNPDLYYFSGYKEPNSVLLVFKDMQADGDSSYNEVLFVRHRDAGREQWTGRRLGVEGAKSQLGFKRVYNGEDFAKFPVDFKKFANVYYDNLPEDVTGDGSTGELKKLIAAFRTKAGIPDVDRQAVSDMNLIANRTTPQNLSRMVTFFKSRYNNDLTKASPLVQELLAKPDSATLMAVKAKIGNTLGGTAGFGAFTSKLRGVKTTEELAVLKKAIQISSLAHLEVMKAVKPSMSEREVEGIMTYVHKRYGAEDEGYAPIVGAGANGCILHYEENSATKINNQLLLMDVGAEYHGYSADVTRTVPANGKFTEEQKAIYQLVYDAQEEIFKLCKAGVPYASLEQKSAEVLTAGLIKLGIIKNASEVRRYYPHGCSHHLGLDVHDKGGRGNLEENWVITVEPGIYIPAGSPCDKKWWNIGIRIEDDVQIGKDGGTNLSIDAPRKWQDVEKAATEKSIFEAAKFPKLK
ncbi:aminopeptidase P family protein [Mucilaginibacter kameinonensis]|uniref:aminopeptidase P family protein n=1 Tax=Mucilaginibacter kameinonensis TaxID=452286 RepID=UPI000EF7AF96|nr:aminopeptidase P family protein [Mucilaginibacter kameinonensis]